MPLMKYFGFVGSALVLLLIGISWCFPQPAEPLSDGNDRPAIRIASAEQLPERIVIDTSLPTIVPPPSVLEFAERWPQEPATSVEHLSKPVPPAPVSGLLRKQNPTKQEPPKKIAAHRAAPKTSVESGRADKIPASPSVTRLALLDVLKDGVAQTQARLIASLEPLAAYVSKP